MRFKNFLFFIVIFLFSSCSIKNISDLNFAETIFNFNKNFKVITSGTDSLIQQILYKDRYNRIIQEYNLHYGYWYQIRRNDSLYGIAKRNGLSINLLASVNKISKNALLRWQDYLFIPVNEEYIETQTEKIEIKFESTRIIWPLWGRITSKFGIRHRRLHKGIDIAAPPGTKIMAADDGNVIFAGPKKRYGYVVIINHRDNFQTRYAHLSKTLVHPDNIVQKGELIGFVGKTGRATGYHLHFEIRLMGEPVDPEGLLPDTPNRLAEIYLEEKTGSIIH